MLFNDFAVCIKIHHLLPVKMRRLSSMGLIAQALTQGAWVVG